MRNVDPEMQELIDALGSAIVPKERRSPVFRVNRHHPYYSSGRWRHY